MRRSTIAAVSIFAGACWLSSPVGADAPGARPQSVRQVAHTDDSGVWIETEAAEALLANTRPAPQPVGAGIIWHMIDPVSITESVSLADTTDESWVGHCLNSERLSYLQTTGTGTPIYEFSVQAENPDRVVVASAEDASLGVLLVASPSGVSVRAFDDTSGPTPLWTYDFPANYSFVFIRDAVVSADGSIVAAVANDSAAGSSLLVLLDGADGGLLNTLPISGFVQAVELSDDGSRAVLTEGATARVVETAQLTTLHSFAVSGGGGYHRLSRDGKVVAAGGFNLLAYREIGEVWTQVWNQTQANNWFGAGLALSADGDTMFVAHYNYATGYVDLTYRVIDLVGGVEESQTTTNGAADLQDTVQGAQASADGEIFSVASWGTVDNVHPEVQIFDRDLTLIGEIDTPGSPFSIDMSRDGRFVVTGGKAIHANISGNGSDTYAYRVFAACPWDCGDGDGTVGIVDFLELLAQWGGLGNATSTAAAVSISPTS